MSDKEDQKKLGVQTRSQAAILPKSEIELKQLFDTMSSKMLQQDQSMAILEKEVQTAKSTKKKLEMQLESA